MREYFSNPMTKKERPQKLWCVVVAGSTFAAPSLAEAQAMAHNHNAAASEMASELRLPWRSMAAAFVEWSGDAQSHANELSTRKGDRLVIEFWGLGGCKLEGE